MTVLPELPVSTEYEQRARRLLDRGLLGHGVHEDLLIRSAGWFDRPLEANGGAFGEFFRAALEHHVALFCAVDINPDDENDAADLHAFLQVVLHWICKMPAPILRKSPEPLQLIVVSTGTGHNLGAQILEKGGPSLIYWGVFRSLRRSLRLSDYQPLAEEIRRTLVHEMIGHQLAFCTPAGPLVPQTDLRDILRAAGIRFLKLNDSPSIEADAFLQSRDLLSAIRRIQYLVSRRDAQKYYSNLTELIAFAVEDATANHGPSYGPIHKILRRNLLRCPDPLNEPHGDQATLYEGYDFSTDAFPRYFIAHADNVWSETEALRRGDRWLTLADLLRSSDSRLPQLATQTPSPLQPGRSLFLSVDFGGYLLEISGNQYLASSFGLHVRDERDLPSLCAAHHEDGVVHLDWKQLPDGEAAEFVIHNTGTEPLPIKLLELKATSPARPSTTTGNR